MNNQTRQHVIDFFEDLIIRIPESGCWIWPENEILILDGFETRAERIAYEIFNGPIASSDKITHKCNLKCCLNPKHMSLDVSTTQSSKTEMDKNNRTAA